MSPGNRSGTLSVSALANLLSARDIEILTLVRDHRFVTTRQIQRLLFWQHATVEAGTRACVRVLGRLLEHRLIYRLERQIGGSRAGSAAYVWRLDDAGDRLMRSLQGSAAGKRMRALSPSLQFLSHTLAITEIRARLEEGARGGRFELLGVTTEPHNWRSYHAARGPEILKPDLHAITATSEFEDHWFLELDLGTESIPTVIRKCLTYQSHWTTGHEQAAIGIYPQVVWLIHDDHRRERLRSAIDNEGRLNPELFAIEALDEFIARCAAATTTNPKGGNI